MQSMLQAFKYTELLVFLLHYMHLNTTDEILIIKYKRDTDLQFFYNVQCFQAKQFLILISHYTCIYFYNQLIKKDMVPLSKTLHKQ